MSGGWLAVLWIAVECLDYILLLNVFDIWRPTTKVQFRLCYIKQYLASGASMAEILSVMIQMQSKVCGVLVNGWVCEWVVNG